jgi:predicted metal-dependent hydrolase
MRSVQYGDRTIVYTVQERPDLKAHYLSVDKEEGVVLKGLRLPIPQADKLVLRKARWILEKLALVQAVATEDIVTGSRITYLGRQYYTEVVVEEREPNVRITFNHSRFRIYVGPIPDQQPAIQQALTMFFRAKAEEKLTPRLRQLAAKTGLVYTDCKVRTMEKSWGSCTVTNTILLNPDVVKLPYSLIDYVMMHELCHTKVKDHSKEFWAELSKHVANWKELDARIQRFTP